MNSRAIVLGASMAGLCAARALSDHVDEVLVLDRDDLASAGTQPRPHVPQGRHPHLLLTAGARALAAWFPGIVEELVAGGAVEVDLCRDFLWHQGGAAQARPASALLGPSMSRPFLEATVRARVASLPNVTVRGGTTAIGLEHAPHGGRTGRSQGRVTGVRLADGEVLAADLVVDCTGRSAASLAWLAELGYAEPPTSVVHVDTRYVTRTLRRAELPLRDWKVAVVVDEPRRTRLALVLPVEGDRWLLVLGGLNGEAPPLDDEAALEYAASLPSPVIAEVLSASTQLGPPVSHRFPANQRRHVERLRSVPAGWLLLGDAVCSFDPIYGQGMTSAALQAQALGACLAAMPATDPRLARTFFGRASRIVANPWSIAVGGDFVYPGTTGPKPAGTDLVNRYMDQVTLAGQVDDAVVVRLNEVITLLRRPESLLAPMFAVRVFAAARRARRRTRAGASAPRTSTRA